MNQERYSGLSRALHWISALIILGLIVLGWYMTGLAEDDPSRRGIYGFHKAMGILTVFLFFARIVWLRIAPAPALPSVFNEKERLVTKGVQSLLYVLILLIPVSGYVMSMAGGHPVSFFGLFDMPVLMGKNEAVGGFAHEAHAILSYAALALVALHMAGAIKHRLLDKNGPSDVLARML
jgi:cytochrome b561